QAKEDARAKLAKIWLEEPPAFDELVYHVLPRFNVITRNLMLLDRSLYLNGDREIIQIFNQEQLGLALNDIRELAKAVDTGRTLLRCRSWKWTDNQADNLGIPLVKDTLTKRLAQHHIL